MTTPRPRCASCSAPPRPSPWSTARPRPPRSRRSPGPRWPGPGPNGALLGPGAAGAFDERANFTTGALPDGGTIRLYYGGSDATGACAGITGSHWRIGLAESTDGVSFTRVPGSQAGGAMIDNGPPGSFDSQLTYRPNVLRDVLPTGAVALPHVVQRQHHAVQLPRRHARQRPAHRLRRVERRPRPGPSTTTATGPAAACSRSGPPGAIDAQQVGYVWVLKDGAEYKMYYSANDATNTWRVALATSSDARHWTKVPGKLAGGAILDVGPAGSFDFACAYQPSVVKERDQLYRMWYRGCVAPGPFGGPSKGTIGYAESNDGITWVKIPQPEPDGSALGVSPAPAVRLRRPDHALGLPRCRRLEHVLRRLRHPGQYSAGLARAPR